MDTKRPSGPTLLENVSVILWDPFLPLHNEHPSVGTGQQESFYSLWTIQPFWLQSRSKHVVNKACNMAHPTESWPPRRSRLWLCIRIIRDYLHGISHLLGIGCMIHTIMLTLLHPAFKHSIAEFLCKFRWVREVSAALPRNGSVSFPISRMVHFWCLPQKVTVVKALLEAQSILFLHGAGQFQCASHRDKTQIKSGFTLSWITKETTFADKKTLDDQT